MLRQQREGLDRLRAAVRQPGHGAARATGPGCSPFRPEQVAPDQADNRGVSNPCVFCGASGPLTREHVFGQWVSRIGLDLSPVVHKAGPLNRIGRDLGMRKPFQQTVKNCCADCNGGWMSRLEETARRVLTPLILGESSEIAIEDQPAIAAWVQKTALTAMLVSSEEERAEGYGLPLSEYAALYAHRDQQRPADATQFWVGRYDGTFHYASIRVTPIAVRLDGIPEPKQPHGYTMTMALGQLILRGVRFTTPELAIKVIPELEMAQLWPTVEAIEWPTGRPCTDDLFLRVADAKMLQSTVDHVELRPWTPATDLPQSIVVRKMVRLPTACGKHSVFYPSFLVEEAVRGRHYAFATQCECPVAYLIETEPDGAHCKAADTAEVICDYYENLPGDEIMLRDREGYFFCKRLQPKTDPRI